MQIQIDYVSLADINPYSNNPRIITREAIEEVKLSIQTYGFLIPILLGTDNVIVAGHVRFQAAAELGLKKVPCINASDLTEDQQRGFRLMENKSHQNARWDEEKQLAELRELGIRGFDLSLTGFPDFEDISLKQGTPPNAEVVKNSEKSQSEEDFFEVDEAESEKADLLVIPEPSGKQVKSFVIRIGKHELFTTEAEYLELERLYLQFLKSEGNDFGFIKYLTDGVL